MVVTTVLRLLVFEAVALHAKWLQAKPPPALAPTAPFSTRSPTSQNLKHDFARSSTTSHVLTPVVQNGLPIRSVLRQEEDRDRCRPLQGTPHRCERAHSRLQR